MVYLAIVCIIGLLYVAWRVERIEGLAAKLVSHQDQTDIKSVPDMPPVSLAHLPAEWMKMDWAPKSRQEENRPLDNPNILQSPDEFTRGKILQRLEAISDPSDRIAFLRALLSRQAYLDATVTGVVLRDESPLVRAWGAGNLSLEFRNYIGHNRSEGPAPLIADYTDEMLGDTDPIVAASVWTNPDCRRLPWSFIYLSNEWKEHFQGLSKQARLALVQNSDLSIKYVVALLKADTSELGIDRDEHAQLAFTAAKNMRLVVSSRRHGREWWTFEGDPNSPSEEFGQMWEAAVDKWMDRAHVPFAYLKYIQTTPMVKLSVYQKLLGDGENNTWLRQSLLEGCDALTDKEVLKLAWDDPDEKCREIARQVVGHLKGLVGVK